MKIDENFVYYLVSTLVEKANDAIEESKENPTSEFYDGKCLAYYEVLDSIKSRMEIYDISLEGTGLEVNLEDYIIGEKYRQ